jgi:hypothetical protein
MLAMMLRKAHPNVLITESHPKALLLALRNDWKAFSESFGLDGPEPPTEHERDALIGAVAVREGSLGRWKLDLALHLGPSEIDPKAAWFGEIHYWWPAEMLGDEEAPKPKAPAHIDLKPRASTDTDSKTCPECNHVFKGKGWSGMDAHWKARHEHLLRYEEAWPLIEAGKYKSASGG